MIELDTGSSVDSSVNSAVCVERRAVIRTVGGGWIEGVECCFLLGKVLILNELWGLRNRVLF